MAGFYAFVVHASEPASFPQYRLVLDPGIDVFNLLVEDLLAFEKTLAEAGVRIIQASRLDEETTPDLPQLP